MSKLPIHLLRLAVAAVALGTLVVPAAAQADTMLTEKTVTDATGGARAYVQMWRRAGDGAVYPKVWVADTKADGICAHAAVLWHHKNGATYADYGSWVCGAGKQDGPKPKPARNWRQYRSVSLAAFVDGRDPVPVPLYDLSVLEAQNPPPAPTPGEPVIVRDADQCQAQGRHLNQRWTARFYGSRHEIGRYTGPPRPTGVPHTPEETKELVTFPIGEVKIGPVTTCRTKRGWGIRTPVPVRVAVAGLTADGKPKGSRFGSRAQDVARGWGLGLAGGTKTALRFRFIECEERALWKALGYASLVPIPKLKLAFKLPLKAGLFVAGKYFGRGKVKCSNWGTRDLKLMVEPDGDLVVRHARDKTKDLTQRGEPRVLWDLLDPELERDR